MTEAPIHGLQKLTLLDYPGKTACTVFFAGCNFRCPFCHNAGLVLRPQELPVIPYDTLFSYLEKRRGILDGVCITGGEPTLYPQLPELIAEIRNRGFSVKLDTNGTNPAMLRELIDCGSLDYAAMDVKSSKEGYAAATGLDGISLERIEESVALLKQGRIPYEFRTTVTAELHTPAVMEGIGKWLQGAERYFIQPFVDSGDLIGSGMTACSRQQLAALLETVRKYLPNAELRGTDVI